MADLLTRIRAEIDARLRELSPAIAEYERLSAAAAALAGKDPAAPRPEGRSAPQPDAPARASARTRARHTTTRRARRRERAAQSPTGQAILAALEHGSHTVAELVLVTALPAPDIRDSLRQLRAGNAIVKTDRDGRAAYALPAPAA